MPYSNGSMTSLGTMPGGGASYGNSINDSGQITRAFIFSLALDNHGFLYSGGSMYDLNNLVSDGLPDGVFLERGEGINDSGWIIADDGFKTYLLQPVPEPASLALFALGAAPLVVLRMRQA